MDTKKRYYDDSHERVFTATVLSCEETKGGFAVILDETAFYPTGGGQACDLGTLDDAGVLAVSGEDTLIHLCDKPLAVGSRVTGKIDWARRFDLMQQHSGEHIVSGLIHAGYGCHNVGFHVGADVVTIDFDGPIPADALPEIEAAANAVIWENRPVRCFYPSEAELPTVPYRRKKDLAWPVRIVEIPGADICACCGTHVKNTGEIGLVKLFSCVKFHEGVRMEMACGARALALLNTAYDQNRLVSQAFSAKMGETGAAAARMNEALSAEKLRGANLERRLFAQIADSYRGQALALHFEESLTPAANRQLCDAIAAVCGTAVTCAGTDAEGYALCIISRECNANAMGQAACAALSGRGGGKTDAFGGRVGATAAQISAFFVEFVKNS